jgi:cyclophilin family peptidyl-prolyl cis-trans isomerase
VATPHLNGRHTVFGQVISGMENVDKLNIRDPRAGGRGGQDHVGRGDAKAESRVQAGDEGEAVDFLLHLAAELVSARRYAR